MIHEKVAVLDHFELEYFEIRDEKTLRVYSKSEKKTLAMCSDEQVELKTLKCMV